MRFVPAGALVEVTCRTVQGRLLLRPTPILRELTLGVLARAARLYPVKVHAFAFLSNHFHLLVTVPSSQRLAQFMNYLNSNLAREAGRLVQWREKFWGRRYQAVLVSAEPRAQVDRLRYVLAHGVKEGLVASPLDWPGAHSARALLDETVIVGRWVDRTLAQRALRKRAREAPEMAMTLESLCLTPLPCWQNLSRQDRRARLRELVDEIERRGRELVQETGQSILGGEAVVQQDPQRAPHSLKRAPCPLVHAASKAVRIAMKQTYRLFADAYRRAAERLRSGALDVHFPEGAFPPALPYPSPRL